MASKAEKDLWKLVFQTLDPSNAYFDRPAWIEKLAKIGVEVNEENLYLPDEVKALFVGDEELS